MIRDEGSFKAILDDLYDGVFFVDRDQRVTYWNAGAERITGLAAARVVGRACADDLLLHMTPEGAELSRSLSPVAQAMGDGVPREAEVFLRHADGHRVPVLIRVTPLRDENRVIGAVEVFSDNPTLLAARRLADEGSQAAFIDPLTGVGNRAFIESRIRTLFAASCPRDPSLGLLFIDIDRFTRLNERHGREAGDRALEAVAATVRQSIRSTDVIGRWGGDEFVAAVLGVDRARVIMIANKLRAAVERVQVTLGRGESHVTVSIGATVSHASDTPETLVKRASDLLSQGKASGRDVVTFGD
jgi:diguanylate cyclase (GGDEF)-like protein/PAS domain S-box-containing protein